MHNVVLTVKSQAELEEHLERKTAKMIELDYESGASDIVNYGPQAYKSGIALLFRQQEYVPVGRMELLQSMLELPKPTFRARFLVCTFDATSVAPDVWASLSARAAKQGDVLLGKGAAQAFDLPTLH
jgi:hypothetical protein